MCPIYKKKDHTDISNYRLITLLNTDYKILVKVLAIQLVDHIHSLIHEDQVGFIPRRSIFNQIRLAQSIIVLSILQPRTCLVTPQFEVRQVRQVGASRAHENEKLTRHVHLDIL